MHKTPLLTGAIMLATAILFGAAPGRLAAQGSFWGQGPGGAIEREQAQEQMIRELAREEAEKQRREEAEKQRIADEQKAKANKASQPDVDTTVVLLAVVLCTLLLFIGLQVFALMKKRDRSVLQKDPAPAPMRGEFSDEPPPFPTSSRMNRMPVTLRSQSSDEPPPLPPKFRGNKMSGTGHG